MRKRELVVPWSMLPTKTSSLGSIFGFFSPTTNSEILSTIADIVEEVLNERFFLSLENLPAKTNILRVGETYSWRAPAVTTSFCRAYDSPSKLRELPRNNILLRSSTKVMLWDLGVPACQLQLGRNVPGRAVACCGPASRASRWRRCRGVSSPSMRSTMSEPVALSGRSTRHPLTLPESRRRLTAASGSKSERLLRCTGVRCWSLPTFLHIHERQHGPHPPNAPLGICTRP